MSRRYTKPNENQNLALWDAFFLTPPTYTKQFSRRGGFKGTALQTMYVIERLTETFGPFGKGWHVETTDVKVVPLENEETMVYVGVILHYKDPASGEWCRAGVQWGGDYIAANAKDNSLRGDDEALKKAMTDGMLKCAAWLGIGADIHYGLYDDQKYLAYAEEKETERRKGVTSKPPEDKLAESAPETSTTKGNDPKPPSKFTTFRQAKDSILGVLAEGGVPPSAAEEQWTTIQSGVKSRLDSEGVTDADERKTKSLAILHSVYVSLTNPDDPAPQG